MQMKFLVFGFPLLFLIVFSTGCASRYHLIEPLSVDFDHRVDTIPGTSFAVSWRYDVLKEAGNRAYPRIEKQQGVSLLAVRLENFGEDTLLFPEDLLIIAGEDTLPPFYVEETIAMFERRNKNDGLITVTSFYDLFVALFIMIPYAVNEGIKRNANNDMAAELEDYYLIYSTVLPGKKVAGLLALPVVRPGTPLKFFYRKR